MSTKNVSLKDLAVDEYSTKLFGFCSGDVFNGFQQRIVSDAIESSTSSLKTCLTQNVKEQSEISKINDASLQLKEHCKLEAEVPLHNMKKVLDEYFQVPCNALLPEDVIQYNQYEENGVENIQKEMEDLRRRAQKASITEVILQEEIDLDDTFAKTVMEHYDWKDFEKYIKQSKTAQPENARHKLCKVAKDTSDLEKNTNSYLNESQSETDANETPVNRFTDLLQMLSQS